MIFMMTRTKQLIYLLVFAIFLFSFGIPISIYSNLSKSNGKVRESANNVPNRDVIIDMQCVEKDRIIFSKDEEIRKLKEAVSGAKYTSTKEHNPGTGPLGTPGNPPVPSLSQGISEDGLQGQQVENKILDFFKRRRKNFKFSVSDDSVMALILDPGNELKTVIVVEKMVQLLPAHWKVLVIGSKNSKDLRELKLQSHVDSGRSFDFWDSLEAEKILIFQTDSILCSKSSHTIEEYLKYDYVGAPWYDRPDGIGNGGFSLRSRSKFAATLEGHIPNAQNEDWWISTPFLRRGAIVPDLDTKKTFCVETLYYDSPLAVHAPWKLKGLTKDELEKLLVVCPELSLIMPG